MDQSSLTGESEPKAKKPEFSHENPLETENLAFFHTRAAEGSCIGIVFKVGSNTVYGRIAFISTGFDWKGRWYWNIMKIQTSKQIMKNILKKQIF